MFYTSTHLRARAASPWILTGAAAAVLLVACKSAPPAPPPPQPVVVHLQAAADLNPDSTGRASPLVVRVYQLRQDTAFLGADFFTLYDHDKESLAADLVTREEYTLKPGDARDLQMKFDPQVRLLGVLAAYRDFRNAQWRALYTLPAPAVKKAPLVPMPFKKKEAPPAMLQVTFAKAAVKIAAQ